ncbi:MAG: hypothetical protein SFT68_04220, partial [Rickettsiaceae bacterium]|nr:hypothetical protein [Rickettsiaceae bacterium]
MAKKFEYIDFPETAIFRNGEGTINDNAQPFIDKIVADHMATMVPQETEDHVSDNAIVNQQDITDGNIPDTITSSSSQSSTLTEEEIKKIKEESYNDGYSKGQAEAKKIFDETVSKQREQSNFIQNISNQLKNFSIESNYAKDYVDLIGGFLDELTNKIIATFPTDFN